MLKQFEGEAEQLSLLQEKLDNFHFHLCRRNWTIFTYAGEARQFALLQEKLDNFHAVKGECPEWYDNWDPNLPLAQVKKDLFAFCFKYTSLTQSYKKCNNNQEMLGWGTYLPLPGFDKKGRMVLFCQMEVPLNV